MAAADKLEDLGVWANHRTLVKRIYQITTAARTRQDFGYRSPIRRASISIMANIAEGFGRSSDKEFARFLDIAGGSGVETQTLLHVGADVKYLDKDTFDELFKASDQVIAQITSLSRYLRENRRE